MPPRSLPVDILPCLHPQNLQTFLSIYHVWGVSQVQNTGTGLLTPAQGSVHCTSSKPFCGSQQPLEKAQAPWWPFAASQFASAGPRCSRAETLCLLRATAGEDALKKAQLWDWSSLPSASLPVPGLLRQLMEIASAAWRALGVVRRLLSTTLPFPFPCCLSTHPLTQHPALLFSPR